MQAHQSVISTRAVAEQLEERGYLLSNNFNSSIDATQIGTDLSQGISQIQSGLGPLLAAASLPIVGKNINSTVSGFFTNIETDIDDGAI